MKIFPGIGNFIFYGKFSEDFLFFAKNFRKILKKIFKKTERRKI